MMRALLQALACIRLTHVPYKGTALAITDLIGGQVSARSPTNGES